MSEILEKRTYDARLYDIVCTDLIGSSETITVVDSITADQGALAFGSAIVNVAPITYSDGTVAPTGKVIQVEISAGTIPLGSDSMHIRVPNLLCTVRARFHTSQSPNQIEATVLLLLQDAVQPCC